MMDILNSTIGVMYPNFMNEWSPIGQIQAYWIRIVLLALVLCCLSEIRRRNASQGTQSTTTLPPGPWGFPVFGNLPQLGRAPHRAITQLWHKYGNVYRLQMGSRPCVVLNGLETIRQALVKHSEEFAGRPDFYTFKYMANGMSMGFSDYGPRWKLHRKIASNALSMFINSADNPMEVNIQQEAEILVSQLLRAGKEGAVNPHNEVFLSVGSIICALCFGKRYKRDDPEFVHLVKNNDEFMAYAGAGNPVDMMPWMRHFTKRRFQGFLSILRVMENFCMKKRQEHSDTYDPDHLRDVTDALLKAADEIDEEERKRVGLTREHILVTVQEMIGAGFDTIATTMQWAILFMATHPEIQKEVQVEVDNIIGKRKPAYKDYNNLPVTQAVILETMRHTCIFPFALPHSTTQDVHFNGYTIPAKTLVFVNLFSVTRDESIFPNPEVFNHKRFLSPEGKILNKMADGFIPFGAGRRKCPGEVLAKMELFIFFSSLMQAMTFSCLEDTDYSLESKFGLTLKPKEFHINITSRR